MDKKHLIALILTIIVSIGIWTGFLATKERYHEDEIYTISSVVSPIWDEFLVMSQDGLPIVRTREEIQSFVRFNGLNLIEVYHNQWLDVHPPLYYLVLHLLIALIPWWIMQAGFILNIICFLIIDLIIIKILQLLQRERAILPSLIWINLSLLAVNMISFQRMYVMVAMFIMLTLYLNLKIYHQKFVMTRGDKIALVLTVIGGFLTQYFYLLYLLPLFIMMIIASRRVGNAKSWQQYLFLHLMAGVIGFLLYPISIQQILVGNRGIATLMNGDGGLITATFTAMLSKICNFFRMMQENWGLPVIIVLGLTGWFIYKDALKEKYFIIIPAIFYLLVVMLIAPFSDLRYISPVMFLPMLAIIILASEKLKEWLTVALALIIGLTSLILHDFINGDGYYLYQSYDGMTELAAQYQDKTLVYVTPWPFSYIKAVQEMLIYDKTVVIEPQDLEKLEQVIKSNQVVLRLDSETDHGDVLSKIQALGWTIVSQEHDYPYTMYVIEKVTSPSTAIELIAEPC